MTVEGKQLQANVLLLYPEKKYTSEKISPDDRVSLGVITVNERGDWRLFPTCS